MEVGPDVLRSGATHPHYERKVVALGAIHLAPTSHMREECVALFLLLFPRSLDAAATTTAERLGDAQADDRAFESCF